MAKGIRVKTSSFTHHHPNVTMCKAKASGNYTLSILAHQEVAHSGYDEAMLMDPQGYVCQGSGENVFLVRDGVIHTPEISGGALDGITRQTIITIARDLGYEVIERRITRDEFYIADEAFFTGTAAEVTPIYEYDDRTIGCGRRGPITTELQKIFFDTVQGKWRADIAAEGSDVVIVTDHHPRLEDPAVIRAALLEGVRAASSPVEVREVVPPEEAIRVAVAMAAPGDTVLWAGPGHLDYRDVGGVKVPFDARALAREALREAGWPSS